MAASISKTIHVLGQNFNKISLIIPVNYIARQRSCCNECNIRYSRISKCFSAITDSTIWHNSCSFLPFHSATIRGSNSCTLAVTKTLYDRSTHSKRHYTTVCKCKTQNFLCFSECRKISTSYTNLHREGQDVSSSAKQDSSIDGRQGDVKENINTIPNILTLGRILCTPVIGYLVVADSFTWALGLFVCAGITDMLDGVIARNFRNQMSALGTALDPLADKILITVLTVTLTTAKLLPVPLAVVIIGRDVLLVAAAFYIRFISLPPPRTLSRYFDVTNPTAKLMPSGLSKINTILQLVLVASTLAAPVFNFVDHPALQALWYITGATTFCSGVGYIWSRNSYVKFLKKDMERKF